MITLDELDRAQDSAADRLDVGLLRTMRHN